MRHSYATRPGWGPPRIAVAARGEALVALIRTAVSFGGDCDTIAAMAAQIAAAGGCRPSEQLVERLPQLPALLAVIEPFATLVAGKGSKPWVRERG